MQEGLGKRTSHRLDCRAQRIKVAPHRLEGFQTHESREWQSQFGKYAAALHGDKPSAELAQAIDGHGHVIVVDADHTDVVAVVTDGRGKRASAEAKALHESPADIAIAPVTFQHADLEQIILGIRMAFPIPIRNARLQMLGKDLAGDDPDHRRRGP